MKYFWTKVVFSFTLISAARSEALSNQVLKVSAESWPPFLILYCQDGEEKPWLDPCPDGGPVTYAGVLWDFLLFVQKARNISFTLKEPPRSKVGKLL